MTDGTAVKDFMSDSFSTAVYTILYYTDWGTARGLARANQPQSMQGIPGLLSASNLAMGSQGSDKKFTANLHFISSQSLQSL